MDPITQGVFGALAAQACANKTQFAKAAVIGALAGMAPDLDVFIRSEADPLLYLEFHRHFTHSLFFIPIGGTLCGLFFFVCLRSWWGVSVTQCLLWSIVGFATHGLLDACTSYGTYLLWPFNNQRIAWDWVSVIDPLITLPLIALVLAAVFFRKKNLVGLAALWLTIYFSLAAYQHSRALDWGQQLAVSRGHAAAQIHAKPSFGNIIIWKVLYENDGVLYVDAVKPGVFTTVFWQGEQINKLVVARDLPWLDENSQQARDIARFSEFSMGFIAVDPSKPLRIVDVRYSQLPHRINPLWGIELLKEAGPEQHANYVTQRDDSREALPVLLKMLVE